MNRLLLKALHLGLLVRRPMTLGVRAAVFDEHGRVCLVRHGYAPGWQLPGGGVETGEDALEALGRELREEAGIVPRDTPRLHGVFLSAAVSPRDHVLVYVVRSFEAVAPTASRREIAERGFFPPDAPPADTTPGTRRRLAEIADGRPPAGARW